MADPRFSQNAARLSEDIGDVLTAIRRMIADDDALSTARDHIRAKHKGVVQDDAGDFLARRHGGNAALARQMVESSVRPLPSPVPAEPAEAPAIPQFILRARPETVAKTNAAPLRLEAERRIEEAEAPKVSGWRAWLRPEARDAGAEALPGPVPASPPASLRPEVLQDMADDADDFAEAFDWKARMRPELEVHVPAAPAEAKPVEQRLSGWAMSPQPLDADPVALLAAEAEAFDAELRAAAEPEDKDQDIRDLLREMVQEELNGELGQRFSANLRAVIRREVASAIDAQLDRF
ncbi:hypothetical protein [Paracoccus sp. (in: a-proteobacteria)]|uniref:hypothetical protein n=1 Tax=Paracoccus sp. TaxID=267 RepID=UPI0035B22550